MHELKWFRVVLGNFSPVQDHFVHLRIQVSGVERDDDV